MNQPANPFINPPLLRGASIMLCPLQASDLNELHSAASDPLIWEQHPDPLRWQRETFERNFFQGALASGSAFIIRHLESGKLIGSSRYYAWDADQQEVVIGYTFLTRPYWGGKTNAELKQLMLDHAFQWARRVWFHVGENNLRSRMAMEKIGGRLSHIQEDPVHGTGQSYAFYVIEKPQAK